VLAANPFTMRQLVWSEESGLLGCSDCSWVFRPPRPPLDQNPEDMAREFLLRRNEAFAQHACVDHLQRQEANSPNSTG
jgi:hypothetical protein